MTDKEKLEKIRSEVIWYIHLRNEGLIIGSCGDFEKLLKFIDSIQEEPKKCMFTKDSYTNEDRKVLCEDCKEKCEHAQNQEPVSEDLDEAAKEDAKIERSDDSEVGYDLNRYGGFVAGAKWQKQQMIDKACEWIKLLNDTHYIMHYSDSCEVTLGELKDWFKNYMED